MWNKVSGYRSRLAVQHEKMKRKAKSAFSSSFFSRFSPSMPVPLWEWSSSIPEVIVTLLLPPLVLSLSHLPLLPFPLNFFSLLVYHL